MISNAEKLELFWQELCTKNVLSLQPGQQKPVSPVVTLDQIKNLSASDKDVCCRVFLELVENMHEHFPHNIYWDLDALVYSLVKSTILKGDAGGFKERIALMMELMDIFGCHNDIRFQYFHDFSFGFDFLKWVTKKNITEYDSYDLFSVDFMRYMRKRGLEMLAMIANDEGKYRKIEPGTFRNSYPFPRDPKSETEGLIILRDRDLIPLRVWESGAGFSGNMDILNKRDEVLKS